MKKVLYIITLCLFFTSALNAQKVPQGMKYQAVARDQFGDVIIDQSITLKIQLTNGLQPTQVYYSEVHQVSTNQFGLFSFVVGEGIAEKGSFADIPWDTENIWMDIALKTKDETQFTSITNSKLLAVPYAFHAATAGKLSEKEITGNANKEGVPSQTWSLFGNSKTNPEKDKLGTTDSTDLVIITNNKERLRLLNSGELVVKENAQFDKNVNIDGITKTDYLIVADGPNDTIPDPNPRFGSIADIRGFLYADSIAIRGGLDIGGNLKVHGDSVIVDHHLLVGEKTFLNGQVTINTKTAIAGSDNNFDSYPLRISGSGQGIAVKVNGSRSNANNFISFWDTNGIQGRIEGQTDSELHDSFDYIWWHEQNALETAFQVAMVTVDLIGIDDADAAAVEGAEMVDIISNWTAVSVDWENNVGIAYESGSGDYAEWLEKAVSTENFSFGDIVGVSGGKVSKNMNDATHYMVVSKSPIVLGNMPPEGKQNDYEKIAFMGQVPVKVRGQVNIGDYIIASDLKDGFGVAVNPKEIELNQLERIVGVAWSESHNELGFSMINVAVGINANDAVNKLKQQEEELISIKNQLNKVVAYLQSKDTSFDAKLLSIEEARIVAKEEATETKLSLPQIDKTAAINKLQLILQDNPDVLKQILSEARKSLDEKGINYNRYDQTKRLVTDETYLMSLLKDFNK
jgi:hypothetical protein